MKRSRGELRRRGRVIGRGSSIGVGGRGVAINRNLVGGRRCSSSHNVGSHLGWDEMGVIWCVGDIQSRRGGKGVERDGEVNKNTPKGGECFKGAVKGEAKKA